MRSPQYEDGRRNGVKACVEWLHEEAKTMNDPHAKAILNAAALHMGTQLKKHTPIVIQLGAASECERSEQAAPATDEQPCPPTR